MQAFHVAGSSFTIQPPVPITNGGQRAEEVHISTSETQDMVVRGIFACFPGDGGSVYNHAQKTLPWQSAI